MPGYKGHLLGGAAAFGLTYLVVSVIHPINHIMTGAEWLACTLAGSLFPDIDIKSKGQKLFYWLILGLMIYFFFYKQLLMLAYVAIASMLPMLVKHRGIFHNMWFIIGISIGGGLLAVQYTSSGYAQNIIMDLIFFAAGALSHLWLDVGVYRMIRVR